MSNETKNLIEQIAQNEESILNSHVGKKTVDGGEIFNSYEDNQATGICSHAEGCGTTASGQNSHAEGESTASGYDSHAEGENCEASGYAAHAEGSSTQAMEEGSHAEGCQTVAAGFGSHAEGEETQANERASHAEGLKTQAIGIASHTEGGETKTVCYIQDEDGNYLNVDGEITTNPDEYVIQRLGHYAHAEGYGTLAGGDASHTEGRGTIASENCAHAEGHESRATHQAAHAEGIRTIASSWGAHSEGENTRASSNRAHAEGLGTIANGSEQHVQGRYNLLDQSDYTSKYAHIVGNGNGEDEYDEDGNLVKQNRSNAHTLDWSGNAWFAGKATVSIEGADDMDLVTNKQMKAYVAENAGSGGGGGSGVGMTTAEGGEIFNNYTNNLATAQYAHAEGGCSLASAWGAHAEGGYLYVISVTKKSSNSFSSSQTWSVGDVIKLYFDYSFVGQAKIITKEEKKEWITTTYTYTFEQIDQIADFNGVEGYIISAEARGFGSHAEGVSWATNLSSHAEGFSTEASGETSHAEGSITQAGGDSSHAEGLSSKALGLASHAEGRGTQALGDFQHVEGSVNIPDEGTNTVTNNKKGKYIHIAGNGTYSSPSNAYTLDWDGNGWFAGTVEATAIILTSPNKTKFKITVDDNGNLSTVPYEEA